MLYIIDEFGHESPVIRVMRKLEATAIIKALCELLVSRGVPTHILSDNRRECVAIAFREWTRRPTQPPDILRNAERTDHHRKLAAPLQHNASTPTARIPTADYPTHSFLVLHNTRGEIFPTDYSVDGDLSWCSHAR
jgi:hypothetical protein